MTRIRSMIGIQVESPDGNVWTVSEEYPNADELTIVRDGEKNGITRMDIAEGDWRVIKSEAENGKDD